MRRGFSIGSAIVVFAIGSIAWWWPSVLWTFVGVLPLIVIGAYDAFQKRHTLRRNFPLLARFRWIAEFVRPEFRQWFLESETDGRPFPRFIRSLIYRRAKGEPDKVSFGTQRDVELPGYEHVVHSMVAVTPTETNPRIRIGGPRCIKPYDASVLNVSGMSFGAISDAAIRALGGGARDGAFAVNTGEGGLSPAHLKSGCDLIWQIGTGYFGCRTPDGQWDPAQFAEKARHPNVVMIEVKLSQGAKAGHGGILPAAKNTPIIAAIRGVAPGTTIISPPAHTAFRTPIEFLCWLQQLRDLSGGKPVGFKFCVGSWTEFLAMCKAMVETGITPDFITVDGAEGGTGAAPLEFADHVGTALTEGLLFVHNALVGFGLRQHIRIIASGKIATGFDIARRLALGADLCNVGRGFMLALGCIHALACDRNTCPTGITTHDPRLTRGLVVADKRVRVANFHRNTVHAFLELIAAAGLTHPQEIEPRHIRRLVEPGRERSYAECFEYLAPEQLRNGPIPERWQQAMARSRPDTFTPAPIHVEHGGRIVAPSTMA